MLMKKLSVVLFGLLAFGFTFAGGASTVAVSSDAKMVSPEWVPPMQTTVAYVFNETGVKAMMGKKNSLLQVNCNASAILSALGFGSSTKKLFSI